MTGPSGFSRVRTALAASAVAAALLHAPSAGAVAPARFTEMSSGAYHACAIGTDGVAWCWGYGSSGERGDGSYSNSKRVPAQVSGDHRFATISAGYSHTCALDLKGKAWCWGYSLSGSLGRTDVDITNVPVAVDTAGARPDSYTAISAGKFHTCALDATGRAWCWGLGEHGQLGNDDVADSYVPVAVDTAGALPDTYRAIDLGGSHSCAIASDGRAWCWGFGYAGALGNDDPFLADSSVPVAVDTTGGRPAAYTSISSGDRHTCAVASGGAVWCWGADNTGQVGDGDGVTAAVAGPAPVAGGHAFMDVSAGFASTCGREISGAAFCWGANGSGQLGVSNSYSAEVVPVAVDTVGDRPDTYAAVSVGEYHTCAIASGAAAWCWGMNVVGQLGDDSTNASTVPVSVVMPEGSGCDSPPYVSGSGPACASHEVTYEILSARSIALESTDTIDFGRVRQGHSASEPGPDIYYATTWAGDAITVDISEDSEPGIALLFDVLTISEPSGTVECVSPGTDQTTEPAELSTTASPVVTGIEACGEPSASDSIDGATATTRFTVDATEATVADTNYTTPVTTIVTYTIDAG